jgi:mannose-6-phosphate isomerase-like protein (cupin superfamily)
MSVFNIEDATEENRFFRRVVYTDELMQVVLMTLQTGQEIGEEVHEGTSQFIRVEDGEGVAVLNGEEFDVMPGDAVCVPAGTLHNIVNTGPMPMHLYTVYSGMVLHATTEVSY